MKKNEIEKIKDNELITEYVKSYSNLCLKYNLNRATKQVEAYCKVLEKELVKRGLLTEEDVKYLHE